MAVIAPILGCMLALGANFGASPVGFLEVRFKDLPAGVIDDLFGQDRQGLLRAINHSLQFMATRQSQGRFPVAGISHDRVFRSLRRFRQIVTVARSAQELQRLTAREFVLIKVSDQVLFTGYFEPVFRASRERRDEFQYPLFRLPVDFASWTKPHPTRAELERGDRLEGLEIAWLADPFEAFLVHVQGSARLDLGNGRVLTVGYAGKTDHPYTSVGRELVRDGKMKLEEVTLQSLQAFFRRYPLKLIPYLQRNESFIFFRETNGQPAIGSLGVPVTAERTIATDKSLLPPGAIALIQTKLPFRNGRGGYTMRPVTRFVLDQDTGSAIRGLNRVDIFMGTGGSAQSPAGLIAHQGNLFYLLLKE